MRNIYDNLEKLLLISQLARSGSVRRAAQELRTSQTAVLRSLNIIEDCFQARLFTRSNTGIEITPVGLEVIAFADRLKSDVAQLSARVRSFTEQKSQVLHIAVSESVPVKSLSRLLAVIEDKEPTAEIAIHTRANDALFAGIQQNKFQFAVTDMYCEDIRLQRDVLQSDRFAFFGRSGVKRGSAMPALKLVTSGHVMSAHNLTVREHLARMGLLSLLKCETPGFELALAMAESSSVIAVLPRMLAGTFVHKGVVQEVIDHELGLQEFGEYRIFLYTNKARMSELRPPVETFIFNRNSP